MMYVREHGCPWYEDSTFMLAVENKSEDEDMDLLQWLLDNDCPMNGRECFAAAKSGLLNTLKWLRERGFPWGADTLMVAARYGYLDLIKWAREQDCP
jgi:hypothetical protein